MLLEGQRIQRQVFRAEGQRLLQRRPPPGHRLPRQAEDQVQVDIVEAGRACLAISLPRLARVVETAQELQFAVVEALHAQAEPVDACRQQAGQLALVHRARVGLYSHLGVGCHIEIGAARRQHIAQ